MSQKNIGIWVRVSKPNQVETESHIHHKIRAENFAKARGWNVAKVYSLEAMTGKSITKYVETQQMLNDIKSGVITGLIFSKIGRLARNTKELIEIAEFFNQYNADLVSMDMSVDTSTPIGRHFYRTMASMAEWEREMIVDRINSSIATRAELGKHLGGQPPLGYKYVDKKLVVDKNESLMCKLIFELFFEHKRKKTVARLLNEKGYRTRKGNKFTDATIRRILVDPVYKGLRRMNYSTMSKDGVRVIKPKEQWVFHKVEPTITQELWDSVDTILSQQSKPRSQPLNTKIHLFTKYVFCHCGARMFTHNKTQNYLCRKHCGNKIHKEDLEEIFKTELQTYTISQSQMDSYFEKLYGVISAKEKELKLVKKEKEKVDKEIENLLNLHNQGQIETTAFQKYHNQPYQRLLQLQKTEAQLEGEILGFSNCEASTNNIMTEAKNLYENWDSLDKDKKRNVIETITDKIIVGIQDITINLYKILPDSFMSPSFKNEQNGQRNQLVFWHMV